MRILEIIAAAAVALPSIASAQVGPNPAVSGGSQDPTVGASTDSVTAPQDAQIGTPARGNVMDRPVGSGSDATVSDGGAAASTTTPAATGPTQTTDPQTAVRPQAAAKRTRRR